MASKLLSNEFQKHICLDYECTTIEEAIHKAGDLLVQVGCVKPPYINGMIRREQETSTDIGLGVMIPHGTEDTLNFVLKPEKCDQFLNASSKQKFIDMINQNYVEEGEL